MIPPLTPDEIRFESERRLAISTVLVVLCLNLAIVILELHAAGPALATIPPVISLRLAAVVSTIVIVGVLSVVKTRSALELTIFAASLALLAMLVGIRALGAPSITRVLVFDMVFIPTAFMALPSRPGLALITVVLLGVTTGIRVLAAGASVAASDGMFLVIVYVTAIALGYISAAQRNHLRLDLVDARNAELDAAMDADRAKNELQSLRGIIPICSHCHRVRIEDGRLWEAVDMYVSRRTDAAFSHGVCPDCLVEHYPDVAAAG